MFGCLNDASHILTITQATLRAGIKAGSKFDSYGRIIAKHKKLPNVL